MISPWLRHVNPVNGAGEHVSDGADVSCAGYGGGLALRYAGYGANEFFGTNALALLGMTSEESLIISRMAYTGAGTDVCLRWECCVTKTMLSWLNPATQAKWHKRSLIC